MILGRGHRSLKSESRDFQERWNVVQILGYWEIRCFYLTFSPKTQVESIRHDPLIVRVKIALILGFFIRTSIWWINPHLTLGVWDVPLSHKANVCIVTKLCWSFLHRFRISCQDSKYEGWNCLLKPFLGVFASFYHFRISEARIKNFKRTCFESCHN